MMFVCFGSFDDLRELFLFDSDLAPNQFVRFDIGFDVLSLTRGLPAAILHREVVRHLADNEAMMYIRRRRRRR